MSAATIRPSQSRARTCQLLVALVVSLACGCHDEVTILGEVTVPVEVQRLFSRDQPGSVEVMGSKAGGSTDIRYLCEPTDQPLVLPYRIREYGCASEQLVETRAYKVTSEFLPRVRCGEGGAGSGGLKGQELAYASAPVFMGQTGCESGEATVDLTLAIK